MSKTTLQRNDFKLYCKQKSIRTLITAFYAILGKFVTIIQQQICYNREISTLAKVADFRPNSIAPINLRVRTTLARKTRGLSVSPTLSKPKKQPVAAIPTILATRIPIILWKVVVNSRISFSRSMI